MVLVGITKGSPYGGWLLIAAQESYGSEGLRPVDDPAVPARHRSPGRRAIHLERVMFRHFSFMVLSGTSSVPFRIEVHANSFNGALQRLRDKGLMLYRAS